MDGFKLRVRRSLDLERTWISDFSLILTDNLGNNKTFVKITVNDTNDHNPYFLIPVYEFWIASQTQITGTNGVYVGSVLATDDDFWIHYNRISNYSLTEPGPLGFIMLGNKIFMQNSPEEFGGTTFNTSIRATDVGGLVGFTLVRITILDHFTTKAIKGISAFSSKNLSIVPCCGYRII